MSPTSVGESTEISTLGTPILTTIPSESDASDSDSVNSSGVKVPQCLKFSASSSRPSSALGNSHSDSNQGTDSIIQFRAKYPELYPTLKLHYEASQVSTLGSPITQQMPKIELIEHSSSPQGGPIAYSGPSSSLSTPEVKHPTTLALNDLNNIICQKKTVSAEDIDKTKSFHDVSKESSPAEIQASGPGLRFYQVGEINSFYVNFSSNLLCAGTLSLHTSLPLTFKMLTRLQSPTKLKP